MIVRLPADLSIHSPVIGNIEKEIKARSPQASDIEQQFYTSPTDQEKLYLLENYKKRLEAVTQAFKLSIKIQKLAPSKLQAIQATILMMEQHYKLKLDDHRSLKEYQTIWTEYVKGLESLLVDELNLSRKQARKLFNKADQYSILLSAKPPMTTVSSFQTKENKTHYFIQMEIPQFPLNNKQAQAFLDAANPEVDKQQKPKWFQAMSDTEQKLFSQAMEPIKTIEDLKNNMRAISSRLRTIPGLPNFSKHVSFICDEAGNKLVDLPSRYRSSMVASRDLRKIKDKKLRDELRKEFTEDNIKTLIQTALQAIVDNEPNITAEELSKRPILLQTLISPIKQPDKSLFNDKNNAIEVLRKIDFTIRIGDKEITIKPQIISTNHPLNPARYLQPTSGKILPGQTKKQVNALIELATNRINDQINKQTESKEVTNIQFITEIKDELKKLLQAEIPIMGSINSLIKDNHRELHLAALEEILVTELGGFSYGSCVSGKDRKGIETLYVDAMRLYYAKYNTLPKFNDTGIQRENFVALVADLYLTRHQHENAGQNAPGAAGIKTPKIYLPKDIRNAIIKKSQNDQIFKESNRLASNNELDKVLKKGDTFKFKPASTLEYGIAHSLEVALEKNTKAMSAKWASFPTVVIWNKLIRRGAVSISRQPISLISKSASNRQNQIEIDGSFINKDNEMVLLESDLKQFFNKHILNLLEDKDSLFKEQILNYCLNHLNDNYLLNPLSGYIQKSIEEMTGQFSIDENNMERRLSLLPTQKGFLLQEEIAVTKLIPIQDKQVKDDHQSAATTDHAKPVIKASITLNIEFENTNNLNHFKTPKISIVRKEINVDQNAIPDLTIQKNLLDKIIDFFRQKLAKVKTALHEMPMPALFKPKRILENINSQESEGERTQPPEGHSHK